MKSGLGLDSIDLHSPLRVDAMLFIIALATMVFTLMDAISGNGISTGAPQPTDPESSS